MASFQEGGMQMPASSDRLCPIHPADVRNASHTTSSLADSNYCQAAEHPELRQYPLTEQDDLQ